MGFLQSLIAEGHSCCGDVDDVWIVNVSVKCIQRNNVAIKPRLQVYLCCQHPRAISVNASDSAAITV